LAETIKGLYKPVLSVSKGPGVIHRRGPRGSFEAVEYATLEWVDWFNDGALPGPIGNIRLPKPKSNIMLPRTTSIWLRDSQPYVSRRPGAVQLDPWLSQSNRF